MEEKEILNKKKRGPSTLEKNLPAFGWQTSGVISRESKL